MPVTPEEPITEPPGEAVRFSVLGPVRVWRAGQEVPLGPRQQRLVLAALLARAGRPVSLTQLVALLWEEDPPRSAANAVHRYVGALRRLLEPGLPARAPGRWLVRQAGGYVLRVDADHLDLLAFRAAMRQARALAAAGDAREAANRFGSALEQWQGRCAADLEAAVGTHPLFTSVDNEYAAAVSEAADAALHGDPPASVLAAVRQAARRHPWDERLQARLLLLLASHGRQAEALLLYRRVSAMLREELGVEPGAELRAAHEHVLQGGEREHRGLPGAQDAGTGADLDCPPGGGPAVRPPYPVPAQLPADLPCFVGRERALEQGLDLAGQTGRALRVLAIDGIPGVGKTALAVRLAHRVAARFPDGQLFADLGGFTAGEGGPSDPGEVLYAFLESLGVERQRIPHTTGSRAALFRSVLATRRVLVVLDDVRDVEQVRPLLPGAPRCMVVITGRGRLSGLAAAHGARMIGLGVFSEAEAVRCLAERVGFGPDADTGVVQEIVERCGRLPLALSVVAARAAGRPGGLSRRTVAELADTTEGLDGFSDDDRGNDLRAAFARSHRTLSPDAARAFRLLPSHGRPDLTASDLELATGLSASATAAAAGDLVRARLLTAVGPDRYEVHPLILAYAAERGRMPRDRWAVVQRPRADRGRAQAPVPELTDLFPRVPRSGLGHASGGSGTRAVVDACPGNGDVQTFLAAAGLGGPARPPEAAAPSGGQGDDRVRPGSPSG
ncbi:BTAD domain-containing putative transcriptional regulator [Streptomyces sp. NPDC101209]|uniref:AfsR/SARP family transcriptional regulator n=1 Tax=Streptomyces sp. NPDC101209 TaxID=3366129 RepID=UPI0037F94F4C